MGVDEGVWRRRRAAARGLGRENVNEKADYGTACGVVAQLTLRLMSVCVLESTSTFTTD